LLVRDLCGWIVLIVEKEVRDGLFHCGLVKDMVSLKEKIPDEIIIWAMEHRIYSTFIDLTVVAFEKYQPLAYAYTDVINSVLVCPRTIMLT